MVILAVHIAYDKLGLGPIILIMGFGVFFKYKIYLHH